MKVAWVPPRGDSFGDESLQEVNGLSSIYLISLVVYTAVCEVAQHQIQGGRDTHDMGGRVDTLHTLVDAGQHCRVYG